MEAEMAEGLGKAVRTVGTEIMVVSAAVVVSMVLVGCSVVLGACSVALGVCSVRDGEVEDGKGAVVKKVGVTGIASPSPDTVIARSDCVVSVGRPVGVATSEGVDVAVVNVEASPDVDVRVVNVESSPDAVVRVENGKMAVFVSFGGKSVIGTVTKRGEPVVSAKTKDTCV